MEQNVLFEEKVYLQPRDLNKIGPKSIDDTLLDHLKINLEGRCSQHGFVKSNSLTILSRSMGQLEHGRFTGNIVFHIQAQGKVYNPSNGTRITGKIVKRNNMGLYVMYENAIRILVPRDLHLGNEEFEELGVDDEIEIEIRKSRFQPHDEFILSVGVFIQRVAVAGNQEMPGSVIPKIPGSPEVELNTIKEETNIESGEESGEEEESQEEEAEDKNINLLGALGASEQSDEESDVEVEDGESDDEE
jgi:DNA-directed RNA polymerase subunit E'/Rpb7